MFDVQKQSGTQSVCSHRNKHLLQTEHLAEPPVLQEGSEPFLTDFPPCFSDGFTPLMIASCSGGGLETGNSEEEDDAPAVISDFIYQGASLHNQTDRTGETALHLAARYSRSDAAKRLLEASADANIQDNMGRTPLHAAVSADAQGVFQVTGPCTPVFLQKAFGPACWVSGAGWMGPWAASSGGWQPTHSRAWGWMGFDVPSNPTQPLWFCDTLQEGLASSVRL